MTTLTIHKADGTGTAKGPFSDGDAVARELKAIDVRFERWPTRALAAAANADDVLKAYSPEIDRLKRENGYSTADVIRLPKGSPNAKEARAKFLSEHTHGEDEVRFFVEGAGSFYLHAGEKVYQVVCTAGDLISVPAGIKHWFDMGADPSFTVVRLFTNPEGWVAKFTGDEISTKIPQFEPTAA